MIDRVAEDYEAQIDFTLLADPDNAVIDKQGVVRWKFIEINFRIRPTNEAILAALAELD